MSPSPTTRNIKAIVFDAYGTLFDVTAVKERCEHYFSGQGAAISDIWRLKQLQYTWLGSLMARYRNFWDITKASLRYACKSLGLTLTDEIETDLMQRYYNLDCYPEAPSALKQLADKFPLAILSNGTSDMIQAAARHNKLDGYLSQIFSVEDLGIYKPSPQVYRMAVDELNLTAKEIGFVSSNSWDAVGAKAFGLHVFWINRFNQAEEELGFAPDHTIQTLDDLVALLPGAAT